jgi:hypothetical protein
MSVRAALLGFLRVPAAPSAPAGDADVRIFRAAPNYFRYRVALWLVRTCGAVVGVLAGIAFLRMVPGWMGDSLDIGGFQVTAGVVTAVLLVVEAGALVALVAQTLVSLALLRLDFEQRWYIVSDRSLRIREGLLRMHEKTMTFANIQQVTIEQGPLQRLLGIADLRVRTAGGGGSGGEEEGENKHDLHVAYFHGVADAPRIRDTIRERLKRHADSGLGDPDDRSSPAARPVPALAGAGGAEGIAAMLSSAHALAAEARALRAVLHVPDTRSG